jgi:hypothetical protein
MSENLIELIESQQLGDNGDGPIELTGLEDFRAAVQQMASQALRSLDIFTYDLDPYLYDQLPFIDAVKQLALSSQYSGIRILLQDNHKVQQEGHRLLELARRLTSSIEIRRPDTAHLGHGENFLVADQTGYVHRSLHDLYEGRVDFNDRLYSRQLSTFFTEAWERGEPESSLRRLYL